MQPGLRDSYADLTAAGVQVIGVSEDKTEAQKKFQTKYNLPFTLIADTDGGGGKGASSECRPDGQLLAKRQSFIVKDGKIAWLDKAASTSTKQADDVRARRLADLGVKVPAAKYNPRPMAYQTPCV